MDRVPAFPKPQSPVQVQPAHVPQPPGPGPPFIRRAAECRESRRRVLPSLGLWPPFPTPIAPSEAFWPPSTSDSLGSQHHDPAWHPTHAAAEQSKGPRDAPTAQPQAHPPAAGRHLAAPQQVPRIPAGEPCGRHADAKVSGGSISGGCGVAGTQNSCSGDETGAEPWGRWMG